MRIRIALASLLAAGLAACGEGGTAAVSINDVEALKTALAAAGINQDVRVADTTDGSIAVWAPLPGYQNCPLLWTVKDGKYRASALLKPDGTLTDQGESLAQPIGPEKIAKFVSMNYSSFTGCQGSNNKPSVFPTYTPQPR